MAYISPSNADLGQFSESSDGYRRTQDRADFDPTSPEVRLTRGELKELSKTGGVPIVYGTRQVTGITVYLEERTGVNAGDWQQSIVICEGEIAEVNLLMVNDGGWLLPGNDDVYDRTKIDHRGLAYELWVKVYLGTDGQSANANTSDDKSFTYGNSEANPTSWSAEHTLSGLAHVDIYYKKKDNFEEYGNKKLPKISFRVKGKKCDSTAPYGANPSLVLKDYLTNTRYGCSVPTDEIDDDSFTNMQTLCDDNVDNGYYYYKQYSCSVILDSDQTLIQNIKTILQSCNGQLHWVNGKYKLHIDTYWNGYWLGSEMRANQTIFDFDETHICGGIKIIGERKAQRANQVTAKFTNRFKPDPTVSYTAEYFKMDSVTWPELSSSTYTDFLAEDNNVPLRKEISLKSVTDYQQARFIAQQACLLSRNSLGVEFKATAEALEVSVGDVISVAHSTPAWEAGIGGYGTQGKWFIVREMTINVDGTVNIVAIEYQRGTYLWDQAYAPAEIPDTNLPNIFDIDAPTELLVTESTYSAVASAGLRLRINLAWSHDQTYQLTDGYDFEYKKTDDTNWTVGGSSVARSGVINDFEKGRFDFRVRAKSTSGVYSDWHTLENRLVQGVVSPPTDVTGFSVSTHGSNAVVTWDAPSDTTDLDHIAIGVLQEGSTTWADAIIVGKASAGTTSVVLPALQGDYVAKWVNSSGTESDAFQTSADITVQGVTKVATYPEQQAWAGTLDGFYKLTIGTPSKDVLRFLGSALWDDTDLGVMDNWVTLDGLGGRDTPAIYTGLVRDLGAVIPARVRTENIFTTTVTDGSTHMDYWGKVDLRASWEDQFKLDSMKFELRTTNDDPADGSATWTGWKSFIVMDTFCRGMQLRATFKEYDETTQLTLEEMELIVEMVQKLESDRAKPATTITYDTPFYQTPDLVVTPVNMATGDYMTISSETKTGFGVNFYNSAGASQTRTYNYIARGV